MDKLATTRVLIAVADVAVLGRRRSQSDLRERTSKNLTRLKKSGDGSASVYPIFRDVSGSRITFRGSRASE